MQIKKINQLKKEIEVILSDNKALEIKSIDLKNKSSIADYMIVASGTSSRHIHALSEQVLEKFLDRLERIHLNHAPRPKVDYSHFQLQQY